MTPAAAATLSLAFSLGLGNLRSLACPGPDSHKPFAALPPSLTFLSCRISHVIGCHQDSYRAFCTSLASLASLWELHLQLKGPDAGFGFKAGGGRISQSASFRSLAALLKAYASKPAARLQDLIIITQRLPASVWQRACVGPSTTYDAANLGDMLQIARKLGAQLARMLKRALAKQEFSAAPAAGDVCALQP